MPELRNWYIEWVFRLKDRVQTFPKSLRIFTGLKSLIAISFIFLHLSATTELGQIWKLPDLVQHYFEHKAENKHISILGFLKEHYTKLHTACNQHHADEHKHLPFKANDGGYLVSVVSLAPVICCCTESLVLFVNRTVIAPRVTICHSYFPADIWQPPKA